MKVLDDGGQVWRVSRRWVPWPRRDAPYNVDEGPGDGPGDVLLVMGLVMLLFLVPILLLAALVAGQLLLLVLVLPLVALARIATSRHWVVEVRRDWTPWAEVDGGGWSQSREVIAGLTRSIRAGQVPQRTVGTDPPS